MSRWGVHAEGLGVIALGVDRPHHQADVGGTGRERLVHQAVCEVFHAQLDRGVLALEAADEPEAHVGKRAAGRNHVQHRVRRGLLGTGADLLTGVHEVAHPHVERPGVARGIEPLVGALEQGASQLALEACDGL